MLFDTGSSEFWIPNEGCSGSRCQNHRQFRSGPNTVTAKNAVLEIDYISGKISGVPVFESVSIGGMRIKNQSIGLANVVQIPGLDVYI